VSDDAQGGRGGRGAGGGGNLLSAREEENVTYMKQLLMYKECTRAAAGAIEKIRGKIQ